jgi:hypothetical protein
MLLLLSLSLSLSLSLTHRVEVEEEEAPGTVQVPDQKWRTSPVYISLPTQSLRGWF